LRIAIRDLRIRPSGRRFGVVEVTPADRLDKLAIDKVLDLESFGHGLFPFRWAFKILLNFDVSSCREVALAECWLKIFYHKGQALKEIRSEKSALGSPILLTGVRNSRHKDTWQRKSVDFL
jgi:hypothetical protein